jgi:AcrR family transcriptional regulator
VRVRAERADSRRNREKVLEAADTVFASRGIGAPVDDVARLAGVGVGTVYRHFPTKEALYEAVVRNRVDQLVAETEALAGTGEPAALLYGALARVVAVATEKRDLADALTRAGIDMKTVAGGAFEELERAIGVLLRDAQASGAVRRDVALGDLVGLVSGICKGMEHEGADPAAAARMLGIVRQGLHDPATA